MVIASLQKDASLIILGHKVVVSGPANLEKVEKAKEKEKEKVKEKEKGEEAEKEREPP
jgi:TATA-box binding protein (TBP) (component of TFIID and TFIIIB)